MAREIVVFPGIILSVADDRTGEPAPGFRPTRFVVGGPDDEMGLIHLLIGRAIAAGLQAEIVEAAPGPRSEAQYASELNPRNGDVWIEAAPADGGRAEIDGYGGAIRIDHHQPGDAGYSRPVEESFEASSLGQLLLLLLSLGVCPHALGMWDLDDPTIYTFPTGFVYVGAPYGHGWGVHIPEGAAYGCPGFHWFQVPPEWVLTGAVDHDPVAACRGGRWGGPSEVRAFLLARAAASGRGFTASDLEEAVRMIDAAPRLAGHPTVIDLRDAPELTPATLGADRQPVPGTGGRLGSTAFHAMISGVFPGMAALNWGAQGVRPQGQHIGLIGDTSGLDGPAILASVGAVGVYGAPGKACGGYVPV